MAALCEDAEVGLRDLPPPVLESSASPRAGANGHNGRTLNQSREEAEVERINEALRKHRNNRQRAAAELGISRMGLYKKLHKYGLIQPAENGVNGGSADHPGQGPHAAIS